MNVWDLERAISLLGAEDVRVPPAGPMAKHVGPQLTPEELADYYRHYTDCELTPRIAAKIRAFPVPALIGTTFQCTPEDFHAQLDDVLTARLPGTRWETGRMHRYGSELLEKYWLLDGCYAASPDGATGQLMVLALSGTVRTPGAEWRPGACWDGEIEVELLTATWSNVGGVGFGLGFYL